MIKINEQKWLSNQEIELVKKQFFPPDTTDNEVQYCLAVAKQFNLNPILKQICFVPRKVQDANGVWYQKTEPLVVRDGFLAIAHRTGVFGSIKTKSVLKEVPVLYNGQWKLKMDLVGICKVWRTDKKTPFVVKVAYHEYVQTRKNGQPTKFWADKPDTMIKKVAESQALRKAFNISGLYASEEVDIDRGNIAIDDGGNIAIDDGGNSAIYDVQTENQNLQREQEITALRQLGLNGEFKKGYVKAVGRTYGKTEQLKMLKYTYNPNNKIWVKKLSC